MILTVHLFDGFCGGQFLKEIVGAIVEPVDVAEIPVIVRGGCTHVGVDSTAGLADGFRPVIAGVVGVLPRNTVQNRAFPLAVYHCSIGILDVAGQGGLAVPSVLRRPEHLKGCGLAALAAGEGFNRHSSVGVQFVGAVVGLLPVFRRVVVAVLLGGKGGRHHADAQHHGQQQGRHALQTVLACLAFQVVFPPFLCGNCWFKSIYLSLLGHRPLSLNCCTKVR